MKNLLIISLVIFLYGCGEKFDASTESMIKISYNGILTDLKGEEKDEFIRQYSAYTEQFYNPYGGEGGDGEYEQNDIESLHGLSYSDVVDKVAEHEEYVIAMNNETNIRALTNLHINAISSAKNINTLMEGFTVEYGVLGRNGYVAGQKGITVSDVYNTTSGHVVVRVTNKTSVPIKNGVICANVKAHQTGKEGTFCYDIKTDVIKQGETDNAFVLDYELSSLVGNKNFDMDMYLEQAFDVSGNSLYPVMSDVHYDTYTSLQAMYAEEFKDIVKQHGKAPE